MGGRTGLVSVVGEPGKIGTYQLKKRSDYRSLQNICRGVEIRGIGGGEAGKATCSACARC